MQLKLSDQPFERIYWWEAVHKLTQPRNRGVRHAHVFGDGSATIAFGQPFAS